LKQIADLQFVSNVGVAELLQQIADLQFVVNLDAGILFHIADLQFGTNLGAGVGVLLEEIPDLQFVLNVGACLKFWRKLQICKFRQILATSPTSPTTPHGRKGGLREYARQVGRAQQTIMEWVNAAAVLKNLPDIRHLFDRTYHLAAIHAAPQELWPVFVEALLAQDWTVADTRPQKVTGAT